MKIKSSKSVYFLEDISYKEEMELINKQTDIKPKMNKNKSFGKYLQLSDNDLLKKQNLKFVDLIYKNENENAFFVTMLLLSAHPFINFLDICKEKILDLQNYPVLKKLIHVLKIIRQNKTINVEDYIPFEDCTDFVEGYFFLLRNIHQELCTYMHFEENAWSNQKKGKAFKNIYPEYSPIVEIFQGKILEDLGNMKAGYFEFIKNKNPESILQNNNCKKYPNIIFVQSEIISNIKGYIPTSLITNKDSILSLVIINDDKFYEYNSQGYKLLENIDNIKNINYVVYSKNN